MKKIRVYARDENEWEETIKYFGSQTNRRQLDSIGLRIAVMDFVAMEVLLKQDDDENYLKDLIIACSETVCNPSPQA